MPDYQQRVVDERYDLNEKLKRLEAFIRGEKMLELPVVEQVLLSNQRDAMVQYLNCLNERIARWEKA